MKKMLTRIAALASALMLLAVACAAPAFAEGVTLEMAVNWTGDKLEKLQAVADAFKEETGITVEISAPGDTYETWMKTRMASGSLPDVFETHGWSVARYGEYLRPLTDQPFYDRVAPEVVNAITDKNGDIFVVPCSYSITGINYNKDALEKAGVSPADIRTWDDFDAACAKLKEAGITPIAAAGASSGALGELFERLAPSLLTNVAGHGSALKDGSFDWALWQPINEKVIDWTNKGYFNVDVLTTTNDIIRADLGAGKVGFIFGSVSVLNTALKNYPEARLGILPVPAWNDGEPSSLIVGEDKCYGAWKDSEHLEEALTFLNYLAREDVCTQIATIGGRDAGIVGATTKDEYVKGCVTESEEQFADDLMFIPYFDREFMPDGMWNVFTDVTIGLIDEPTAENAAESCETLRDEYEACRE